MSWTGFAKFALGSILSTFGLAVAAQGQNETDLPAGPGRQQLVASCTACHALTQVTTQLHSEPQWADIVDQMIARGAAVSDDDYPLIVHYLGANFGRPAGATPAGTAAKAPN